MTGLLISAHLFASLTKMSMSSFLLTSSRNLPVTDYRHKVTGLTEEDLKNGMRLQDVQEKVLAILCDGHNDGAGRLLLVGHDLRDTAKYVPLMKTSLVSHSLKYHTMSYLGYRIQCGNHEPYTRECGIKSMERQKKKGKQGMDCTRGNRAI
ncbi:hypothetical protein Bca4012_084537 [Brassica carinata]